MIDHDRIIDHAMTMTHTMPYITAKDIADLVGLHNLDIIRNDLAYRDLYKDNVHMLSGGDTNQRLLWVGSVVGDTVTSLDTARLNGYLLSSHANIDTFRTKVITLVAIYDALRLHRAQWAHAAREHIQMNFTSIASFDLTHPNDAK